MTKKVRIDPGWPRYRKYTFAPAVRRGNMLFISGISASDEDGNLVGPGDIVAQTRYIYQRIDEILKEAGATWQDVVWTTDYITTTENYKATADIRRQYFGDDFPASTGIIVKGLLNPAALIEIDAVAVLDS